MRLFECISAFPIRCDEQFRWINDRSSAGSACNDTPITTPSLRDELLEHASDDA